MDRLEFLQQLVVGPLGWVVAALWGALWGSFFNVVIVRVPARQSIVRPGSRCTRCEAPIAWYDNIPLLSYLVLRGRCRRCGARFSARYLLVELLVSGLSVLLFWSLVVQGPAAGAAGADALGVAVARFVITSLFTGLLVAIAFIDLDTMLIPDAITYPGIPICVGLSLVLDTTHWWDGPVGAVAGYLVIRVVADGYRLLTGRLGMGYGDAKLLAMIGGLLGWQAVLPTLMLAAFQGSVIGITALAMLKLRRERAAAPGSDRASAGDGEGTDAESLDDGDARAETADDGDAHAEAADELDKPLRLMRMPFGPFLSLAAIETLLLPDWMPRAFDMLVQV